MSKGLLINKGIPALFIENYEKGITGEVIFERDNVRKSVFFLKGFPVFATSNDKDDRIGKLLFTLGKISIDQLKEVVAFSKKEKKLIGAVLVEHKYISADELYNIIIKQVKQIIFSLFQWEDGSYVLVEKTDFPREVISHKNNPIEIVFKGIKEYYSEKRLLKLIPSLKRAYKKINNNLVDLNYLDLEESDKIILKLANGKTTLEKIIEKVNLPKVKILASYYIFDVLNIIEPIESVFDGDNFYDIENQKKILERLDESDYFVYLGVSRDADKEDIIASFNDLAKLYEEDSLPDELNEEERELATEIYNYLKEAYDVLIDDTGRKEYLNLVKSDIDTKKVRTIIKKKLAKMNFDEGLRLYREMKLTHSYNKIKEAIRFNPGESDYFTALALINLSDYEGYDADYDEGEKLLKIAVSKNVNNPRNYFYLGVMYKHLGDIKRAKDNFKLAIELNPKYLVAKKQLKELKTWEKDRD